MNLKYKKFKKQCAIPKDMKLEDFSKFKITFLSLERIVSRFTKGQLFRFQFFKYIFFLESKRYVGNLSFLRKRHLNFFFFILKFKGELHWRKRIFRDNILKATLKIDFQKNQTILQTQFSAPYLNITFEMEICFHDLCFNYKTFRFYVFFSLPRCK